MSHPTETQPLLTGVTVLDLSSVGPAARASRILADYGARVVKVGPPARRGGVQIQPPFHSYGAGRGMQRARIDLKAAEGREAFLRLAERADVVIESYRPGVASRLGIGYEDVRARNPGIVYCSTSGYGQEGPAAGWAGHDLNYLALAGLLACSEPRADGGPPIPGATVADSAGGGMHAVIAILAALVQRAAGGAGRYLDVAATDGVLSLMSLAIDQYLATGEVAGPRQTLLTGRYACYDLYECRDGRWLSVGAIEPHFFANLCRKLGLEHYTQQQMLPEAQDEIRGAFRDAFHKRDRDDWVAELAPADTCVAPVNTIPELVRDPHLRARGSFAQAIDRSHGRFEQTAAVLAGCVRGGPPHELRPPEETDTDELLQACGLTAPEVEELRARGAGEWPAPRARGERARAGKKSGKQRGEVMEQTAAADDLPAEVASWIGQERYREETSFPIEMGYVYTSCASVENGNPLFWDEKTAQELTGGPIAPPTMLSVWFRPHHWAPGRSHEVQPLQVHFDLKEKLELPEAVMTDNTIVFGEPVRPGDVLTTCQVLHSVSPLKRTKLGLGRFWEIEVRYTNQRGERVGTELYTGYGYRREEPA